LTETDRIVADVVSSKLHECIDDTLNESIKLNTGVTLKTVRESLERNSCFTDSLFAIYSNRIHCFMDGLQPDAAKSYDNETFGDYTPKNTPDISTDFMPELAPLIGILPAAQPENLNSLLEQFDHNFKKVKKKRGYWMDGNTILGARPREYFPTEEELILSEIGTRIVKIIYSSDQAGLTSVILKKHGHIKFVEFTFTHVDVMGSGRFFYVDTMREVKIHTRKPRIEFREIRPE
jgi:hypothetical protein